MTTWIGADPGGNGAFGVAVIADIGWRTPRTATVGCAEAAVAFVRSNLFGAPAGVGVDSPLWWSSGPSGERFADWYLRGKHPSSARSVLSVNSLRGAALAQGQIFVSRVRQYYPDVQVTEAHPKVLGGVLVKDRTYTPFIRWARGVYRRKPHERDAVLAAVAAQEGFSGRWTRDLATTLFWEEQDPLQYWLAPVHYWWPK